VTVPDEAQPSPETLVYSTERWAITGGEQDADRAVELFASVLPHIDRTGLVELEAHITNRVDLMGKMAAAVIQNYDERFGLDDT
jgi:hypothetical protein